MTNNLLDHLRPATLARLIGELIADHADEDDTGEFTFHTETAHQVYGELLAAGERLLPAEDFWDMINLAVANELR